MVGSICGRETPATGATGRILFPFVGSPHRKFLPVWGPGLLHGHPRFAAHQDFSCLCPEPNRLVLQLTDNGETREQYPFAFSLNIIYELIDNRVQVTYQVENTGTGMLPFGIGGHPGFRIPLEEGEQFDDYILDLPAGASRIGWALRPRCFLSRTSPIL